MSPTTYRIQVEGGLDARHWERWFGDMRTGTADDGTTLIVGEVSDQAALHGVLAQVRDLGLVLVSVQRLPEKAGGRARPSGLTGPAPGNDVTKLNTKGERE